MNFIKSDINKAGKILAKDNPGKIEEIWAIDLMDKWRTSHAYPMNTFNVGLRKKVKRLTGETIVAQRLKRLPTIVDKLKRFPTMELSQMQDIGGLRAIVKSIKDVRDLGGIYKKMKFSHQLLTTKDYVTNPKGSGYRGVHLVYKYKNNLHLACNGMLIELQFRTQLQHFWATAVETMGTFLGNALKSNQGNREWLDFFSVTSSAFAYLEKTQLVPGYGDLTKKQTFDKVIELEKKLNVIDKMKGFTRAVTMIGDKTAGKGWYYHLVILDSINKKVEVKSYSRDQLKNATNDYKKTEQRALNGERIEPVLVSAGPLKSLKTAYPNYFLDTDNFIKIISQITSPH